MLISVYPMQVEIYCSKLPYYLAKHPNFPTRLQLPLIFLREVIQACNVRELFEADCIYLLVLEQMVHVRPQQEAREDSGVAIHCFMEHSGGGIGRASLDYHLGPFGSIEALYNQENI